MEMRDVIAKTLSHYDVDFDYEGIDTNLERRNCNKKALENLLRKHPKWNENAKAIIITETENRPAFNDNDVSRMLHKIALLNYSFCAFYGRFSSHLPARVDQRLVDEVDEIDRLIAVSVKPVLGQKTSRWLRQFLLSCGVADIKGKIDPEDMSPDAQIWRLYASLADGINPYQVDRPLIISVNPADYLTMSMGDNWASCHIINPDFAETKNGSSYSGCYKGGTLSYMNDESSIITYTVDKLPDDITDLPITRRHNRQMFHINLKQNIILQSRFYPYTDDIDAIETRRNIMQSVIAECLGIPNLWTLQKDNYIGFYTDSHSLHYRDYEYPTQNHVSVSVPRGTTIDHYLIERIGTPSYCLVCGGEVSDAEYVHCERHGGGYTCVSCGNSISEDDVYWIHDETYCSGCVTWCERCEEYEINDNMHYVSAYGDVCEYCLVYHEDEFAQCDGCGSWVWLDNHDVVVTKDGHVFCNEQEAHDYGYNLCAECGEWEMCEVEYDGEYFCNADCATSYGLVVCPHCEEWTKDEETCTNCGVVIHENEVA